MEEVINGLKLSNGDKILLMFCPLCGLIGSLVHYLIMEVNLTQIPKTYTNGKMTVRVRSKIEVAYHLKWLFFRLLAGSVLGLTFALYFVGIVKEDITSLSRILAFAILVGYSAPKIWYSQEKILTKYIDQKFQDALSQKDSKIDKGNEK